MKRRRRTRITIQSKELLIVRVGQGGLVFHCPRCGEQMQQMMPDEATAAGLGMIPSPTKAELLTDGQDAHSCTDSADE